MGTPSLRAGDIVRVRDESWVVVRHTPGTLGAILDVRGRDAGNRGARASFVLPCEPIERLPASSTPREVRPRTWRRLARAALGHATPSLDSLRSPIDAALTILPFQLEPALAVVQGRAARVLIADEVGLGKTIQAGLIVSETLARTADARVLIVTPAGLRAQWRAELTSRFHVDSALLNSAAVSRHAGEWGANPWASHPVVVTSLDYIKRPEVVRAIEAMVWDLVIFDEAHALAGRSDRAVVAAAISQRARTMVLLTATPHSGDEDAFARLAGLGDIRTRFPLLVFRRTRADVGIASDRRATSLRVTPTMDEREMHAALSAYTRMVWSQKTAPAARLAMTILTRRACSSPSSLARSVATRLQLLTSAERLDDLQISLPFADSSGEDDEPVGELAAAGMADAHEEARWLTHLLDLAHNASRAESKLTALARLLTRADEPAIVFTEYRDTLARVATTLEHLSPVQLHGGLGTREREEVLSRFAAGDARLLLATDAASEGLNLHHRCRLVVNLELPWTPVRLEQRIGRVERLGQTRRVHAVHLLAKGTCEERSVAVLLARTQRASDALGRMRAAAIEEHIAAEVIGDCSPDEDWTRGHQAVPSPTASLSAGVLVEDFSAHGVVEAQRLAHARVLLGTTDNPRADEGPFVLGRPFITRRRRVDPIGSNVWVYRIIFTDAEQRPLWETLIGVNGRARDLPSFDHGTSLATSHSEQLLKTLLTALHATVAGARARETAIVEALQARRARVALALVQPGLFDRRAERAAGAQQATLNAALARCDRRLVELARLADVTAESPHAAFGIFCR